MTKLVVLGVKIGAATSVRKADWEIARVFRSEAVSAFRRLSKAG
jgi:hypothetical protein